MTASFIIAAVVLLIDQLTKVWSVNYLTTLPEDTYKLWEGVLHLKYAENRGAAFGMLQGGRWFFLALTLAACVVIVWFMVKERKRMHFLMSLSLGLILSGAIGNLIDRAVLGYVRDMIYVAIINFAVFNVADMAICVGCALLVLDLLFFKGKAYMQMLDELDKAKAAAKAKKQNDQEQ